MCTVSMVGDFYGDKFKQPDYRDILKQIPQNPLSGNTQTITFHEGVTKAQFEALKKEVEDMKQLLIRAKIYDEKNNEPNCELESKMAMLRKIADLVGINLDDVINPKP